MDSCFGTVLVVLDFFLDSPIFVDGEDIAPARVVVEGISIDIVRGFLRC